MGPPPGAVNSDLVNRTQLRSTAAEAQTAKTRRVSFSDNGNFAASTQRQKVVEPGRHTVSYFLHSTSGNGCSFAGSAMQLTAHRQ